MRNKWQTLCFILLMLLLCTQLIRVALDSVFYLLVLPYSQFTYPLETDFQRLLSHYDRHRTYPSDTAPINNASFPILHPGKDLCHLAPEQQRQRWPHLLILVKSSLAHREFRDLVRATWANKRSYERHRVHVWHAFVLGGTVSSIQQAKINAEQAMHLDIIQQGFVDAYFNNTYKTMFAFDWAARHCPLADFVLFADDDYYVSPPNLVRLLQNIWPRRTSPDLALGYVFSSPVPKRNPLNRWYIALSEYPYAFWPPYPTGGAVLATAALCHRVSLAQRFVRYLRFDDVFLGIVMRKLGAHPEHHGLFYYELLKPLTRQVYNHVIAMHLDRRLDLLQDIWRVMNYTVYDITVASLSARSLL